MSLGRTNARVNFYRVSPFLKESEYKKDYTSLLAFIAATYFHILEIQI